MEIVKVLKVIDAEEEALVRFEQEVKREVTKFIPMEKSYYLNLEQHQKRQKPFLNKSKSMRLI